MSVTKLMNSKANVKQYSAADLPMQPRQAVIARMTPVESTANQTIINLPWYVDTVNAQDSFFLCIDGQILSLGSANDYTMTSVDVLGFSNQVTLNVPLVAGLNIQAWKLGAKKESEFAQDQRFVNIYEYVDKSFQGFVDQSQLMTATSVAGSPAAGTFYSTITNRSAMVDMRQDLKPRMGIERITTQQIYQLQNEAGPNGEVVWAPNNDPFNQIRYVGQWQSDFSSNGPKAISSTQGDYYEVTFYGTGLNVLTSYSNIGSVDWRLSVDGAAEGANIFPASAPATVLNGRNYSANYIFPVVSGLTLGVHTVKVRKADATGHQLHSFGFEILNESSLIRTNPGIAYNQGKKITTSLQDATSYTSGVTGTRGGRMLVYQNSDGTIGRAFQATNISQANLTGADHSNEDISRVYYWREFGAGRSDDFSLFTSGGAANKAFTLDDGTTAMVTTSQVVSSVNNGDCLGFGVDGTYIEITFVGTGLDITRETAAATDTASVHINGTNVGNLANSFSTANILIRERVVSGLPYGTHTVRLTRTAGGAAHIKLKQFIVYQPKKPTLPSGAIELADYNVMADYSGTTITGTALFDNFQMPVGTLTKLGSREATYSGTWTYNSPGSSNPLGTTISTTTNGDYVEYTFFGTGVVFHGTDSGGGAHTFTVRIDGALNATGIARSSVTNSGGGTYTVSSAVGGSPVRLEFTGLALGVHTIRITKASGSAINMIAFHVITPIHSTKSNLYADLQNSLPVGSQGISDNRKTTPSEDLAVQPKAFSLANLLTSNPSTTSTSPVPMPDMSVTHFNRTGKIKITYNVQDSNSGAGGISSIRAYVDGSPVGTQRNNVFQSGGAGTAVTTSDSFIINVSPGIHKIDLYWWTNAFTHYIISGGATTLLVEEV